MATNRDFKVKHGLEVAGNTSISGIITSTVAQGTAPFVVTSNTAVTNLNADYLDGKSSGYFAPINSPTFTGTVTGPQFVSTIAQGTAPFVVTSNTAVTNLNADYLDGKSSGYFASNLLTGFSSNTGTVSSSDSVLSAIQKLNGNDTLKDYVTFKESPTSVPSTAGTMAWNSEAQTLNLKLDGATLQIGQEEYVQCFNNSGTTIPNGSVVYITGANGDRPTIGLALANIGSTASILGISTEPISNNSVGFVTTRGIIHDLNTSSYTPGSTLYLSTTTPGAFTDEEPTDPAYNAIVVATTLVQDSSVGSVYVRQILNNRLNDLSDVLITSPSVDQILKYNGTEWINGSSASVSAGAGIAFFLDDTHIIDPGSGPQTLELNTLSREPITTTETIDSVSVNNSTVVMERYMYPEPLGVTQIDAGIWTFNTYCYVSSVSGGSVSSIPISVYKVMAGTGTVTITGSGTSRTATVTGGAPFVPEDANADITLRGCLQTPVGIFNITAVSNTSVATISTLSTYSPNESAVSYSLHRFLFTNATTEVINTSVGLTTSQTTETAFPINTTDKLAITYFGRSTGNRTLYLYHNGVNHYTHFTSPLAVKHNDLPDLQGGSETERYHLSLDKYNVVQNTSGTNTGDQTNISGNAATATDADKLDGQHGTYYYAASNPSGYTTNVGTVTSVSGTSPVSVATGTTTPVISMAAATASVNGYMTSTYASKLDGIAAGATNYTHPTGDGNLHVPATSTTNNGKILTAGATAGSISWQNPAPTGVTSVSGTSPVSVATGTTTPVISMAAATASVNGYMTSTYASKLDGIAAGATANVGTVTSVSGTGTVSGLTLTGTVTGSGSLTLGGTIATLNQNTTGSAGSVLNAVTFTTTGGAAAGTTFNGSAAKTIDYSTLGAAPLSHNHAASAITSGTIATAQLGSGTASSSTYLRGDSTWQTISGGATLANDTSTNSNAYYPAMAYNATTGTWTTAYVSSSKFYFNPSTGTLSSTIFNALSDESVKDNIKKIENSVNIVKSLEGVEFNWKENGKKSSGVIAQAIEKVLPHLVEENENNGIKSVNYSGLIGYLIESIKELNERLEKLETK